MSVAASSPAGQAAEAHQAPPGVTTRAEARQWRADVFAILLLVALAGLFYAPAVFGGQVLLPTDNLLLLLPWSAAAQQLDPGFVTPHNRLISDLILQNVGWKRFLADSLRHGQLPLWNPDLQAGTPFLASGQYQVLYPFGLLFVLLPVERAYGYFAALHLFIAGAGVYFLARTLGYRRASCLVAAVTFMFSQRLITSVVWPQMISAMSWLGWILLWMELTLRASRAPVHAWRRGVVIAVVGAATVALQILSGHLEISFYVLFTALMYGVLRVSADFLEAEPGDVATSAANPARGRPAGSRAVSTRLRDGALQLALLGVMGVGGLGLAAVQLVPFSEAIGQNFREGSVTYAEVSGWAMPARQFVAFLLPDVYGNPAQHDFLDVFSLQRRPIGPDAHGKPTDPPRTVSWGTKDYVEGASYVGILPLLLAGLALMFRWRSRSVAIFALIGLVSLLLATGSPLYKPLFLIVPGFSQIHSAFRWVYVYGLAVAILAASGLDAILALSPPHPSPTLGEGRVGATPRNRGPGDWPGRWGATVAGWAAAVVGVVAVAAVAATYLFRGRLAARLQASIDHNDVLARNFADGHEFYSILFVQAFRFAALLALSCLVVWVGLVWLPRQASFRRIGWRRGLAAAAVALVAVDLFAAGRSFASTTPASLLSFTPPVVQRLQAAAGPARIVSYRRDDMLDADTAMLYGLQDVRGYDTIVLRRYADFMNLIEPQTMLLPYSRVKGIDDPKSLHSPLLNVLNIRYVLTTEAIQDPQYGLWYDEPSGVRVYENRAALPRAFVVHQAIAVLSASAALAALAAPGFDPATTVVLEGVEGGVGATVSGGRSDAAEAATYTAVDPQRTEVSVTLTSPGYLVVSDVNFPGWQATVDGVTSRPVLQADEAFRAVALASGAHTVVFRYRPPSLKTGLLVTLGTLAALLLALVWAGYSWLGSRQWGRDDGVTTAARRVAKNSATLMAASLGNRLLDFALIIWATTVIGADGIGRYYFAVAVISFLSTVADYGLVTLVMRDVARDRTVTGRYYANVTLLRLVIAVLLLAPVWLLTVPLAGVFKLTADTSTAIWLLTVAFFPGALAATGSAVLKAYERMDVTALVDVASNILRIGLSVGLLLAGWNIVGLATAALLVNLFSAAAYSVLARPLLSWRSMRPDVAFSRWAVGESTPLMLNQLLNVFFFRVDVLLLKPLTSDLAVGYYGIAYKFIDGLGFISAYLTQALFPYLAKTAQDDRGQMKQATIIGLRVLLLTALPIAAGTVVLAGPIVTLFYTAKMAPSIPALQILVLYLPFSFLNGLIQYVLIALGRQRQITTAYPVACAFNVVANVAAIHLFSYLGAAAVTVASELVLLAPFYLLVRRDLGSLPWDSILVRPAVASTLMAGAVAMCQGVIAIAIPVGVVSYGLALVVTGSITRADYAQVSRMLGWRTTMAVSPP